MIIKNKKMALAGALLIFLSIYLGTLIGYSDGYMKAIEQQKDNIVTKYIVVPNTTVVMVPQIKEVIREIRIEPTTLYTTTIPHMTTTTQPTQQTLPPIDNKTLTRILNKLKEERLRGVSTPLPEVPINGSLNEGRYFVNQSVTFSRKIVSGTIPGMMIEVDEEEIPYRMSYFFNKEIVYNVYVRYWNATYKDITENYTKYRSWTG